MPDDAPYTIEFTFAWWLYPYLHTLGLFVTLTGCEPDWDKVDHVIARAIRIRTV